MNNLKILIVCIDKDLALSISKKIIEINDNLSIMPSFSTDTTYLNSSLSENYIYYLDHRKVNLSYKNNVLLYILTKAYISYGITMDDFYNNDIGYLTIEEYNNIPDVIFNENNILTIWIDQKNRKHHDITLNIEIKYFNERFSKVLNMYFLETDHNIAEIINKYINASEEEKLNIIKENS